MKQLKKWLPLPFLCAALVLMILPIGNLMAFAPGPDERLVMAFSWFDATAWGYGHFFPLIAAILTVVSLVLLVVSCLSGRGGGICFKFLVAAAVIAVMAFLTATAHNAWGAITMLLVALAAAAQGFVRYGKFRAPRPSPPGKV